MVLHGRTSLKCATMHWTDWSRWWLSRVASSCRTSYLRYTLTLTHIPRTSGTHWHSLTYLVPQVHTDTHSHTSYLRYTLTLTHILRTSGTHRHSLTYLVPQVHTDTHSHTSYLRYTPTLTAGCTTSWVNYANERIQAALERSSQDAYDVTRLTCSKMAVSTVDSLVCLIKI